MASTPFQDFPATTNSQWLSGQVFLFGVGPSEAQQWQKRAEKHCESNSEVRKKNATKDGLPWLGLGVHGVHGVHGFHCPQPCSNHRINGGESRPPRPRTVRSAHSGTRRSQRMHLCSPKKHIFLVFCLMRIINQHQIPWCNRCEGWKNDLISSW